ncbi:putative coiled-coil domain-containing protein 104 [Trypanosoma theileri]|uniref:Cilia- and flagella-associated protein 36 n=1 Tax=Trypanosoma theileri TaxID=67003 RepID=A0A1X0P8V3_9TRYP|nr:putative coiled-coil domain-containing protein 104 [Trypanosoma theileri]ORC93063.1 putative coiled-coil domain-containing protein 104 [Trypanosoma theileri]
MSEDGWITESVVQFTRSPLWRTPVDNFVDDNCWLFTDDTEMKVEQTEVHFAFRKLIDELLTSFVQDIGVSLESVIDAVHHSVEGASNEKDSAEQFLNYIFYVDDFRSFHKMMVKRNIQLDILASRALEQQAKGEEGSLIDESTLDEETAIKLAIEASLQAEANTRKEMELEDVQIQEALALSIAAEEERIRRAGQIVQEEAAKEATQVGTAVAEQSKNEKLNALNEEREHVIEKLEARALEVRQETLVRHITATQEVPPTSSGSPSPSKSPSKQATPSKPTAVHNEQSVLPKNNTTTTATAGGAGGAPPASTAQKSVAPLRSAPGKGFGFKPLPSIQPSFKELKETVANTVTPVKPEPVQTSSTPPPPTLEEMEARARYMREQREKILMQKKASREKELQEYASKGGKANDKSDALPDGEKQMTLELARRLREDIVREATK